MIDTKETVTYPDYKVEFTMDNKVLISFFESRRQTESATKDTSDKSVSFFVVLLLSKETGELIRRVEWPVLGESLSSRRIGHVSCIYPLPSSGYVGIINRHLQVLDPSFNVIHDRLLETSKDVYFDVIAPLYGQFFVLRSRESYESSSFLTSEIIDFKTFKTVEKFIEHTLNLGIHDIWEDQLVATRYHIESDTRLFFKKRIGASQWNDLGLAQKGNDTAKFIHNGTIIIRGYTGQATNTKGFWFAIENGKKGELVSSGLLFKPSWNTSIVASKRSYLPSFRSTFDLDSKVWIEAFDLSTQQVLLATKRYSASDIIDYAISPNGDSIVLVTKKKIELYNVSNLRNC